MSESDIIQVGLVGCGKYARRVHLPILLTSPQYRVVALSNRSPEHMKDAVTVAHQSGFEPKACHDWQQLVDDTDVQAIVCAMPPQFNLQIVRRCVELGKPVLIEKPLATTEQDLDEFQQLAGTCRAQIQVGTQLSYGTWYAALEKAVRRKGDLLAINAQAYLSDGWTFEPLTWKIDADTSGGALNSWGVHMLTLLLKLSSMPDKGKQDDSLDYAELVAFTGSAFQRDGVDPAMYDTASLSWMTVSGDAAVPCQLQLALHPDIEVPQWRIQAFCSDGRVEGELYGRTVTTTRRGGATRKKTIDGVAGPGFDGNRQQLEHFAKCVRDGNMDLSNLHRNLTATRMALEINVDPTED